MRPGALRAVAVAVALPACAAAAGTGEPRAASEWYAFPIAFWTPETRLGAGALGGVQFRSAPGARTSNLQATAIYTIESQVAVGVVAEVYPSERTVLAGTLGAGRYPTLYWGIGPHARDADEESFTSRYADLLAAPEVYLVPGRFRAGPRLHLRREVLDALGPRAAVAAAAGGGDAFTAAGAGATATWDTRDAPYWTTRGTLVQAWYVAYPGALSGGRAFGRGALDVRRFVSPWPSHVLGVRARAEAAHGTVPLSLLPALGGADNLRGYYQGRWRDRVAWFAQGEYRFPLRGRFGGVAFAGAGGVARDVKRVADEPVRIAAGTGLRYRLTSEGVNLRADVALGSEGAAFYFLAAESF